MTENTDVVVVGAGPNGLSVAAHLIDTGIDRRVFGRTMGSWRFNMPAGLMLKSEPYGSDLSSPTNGFLVRDYCRDAGVEYHDRVTPLSRESFLAYGDWFARELIPDVEETDVISLSVAENEFRVRTADEKTIAAQRVVVATGPVPFAYVPPELAHLPSGLVSHSSDHVDLDTFTGREILVMGRGQSALETAALLHEQGASVKIATRSDSVYWNTPNPMVPTLPQRLRKPAVRLCEGWNCFAYDRLPDVFHVLPEAFRVKHALEFLGPSGAWWLRERVDGKVPVLTGHELVHAEAVGDRARVGFRTRDGLVIEEADHVIAGTGYRLDVTRLGYLDASLRASLKVAAGAPVLDKNMESSVPGLFFAGVLAAPSFGPLMRFVAGTHFSGPRIARGLKSSFRHRGVSVGARVG